MKTFVLFVLIGITSSMDPILNSDWEDFKSTHGKLYGDDLEEQQRRQVWEKNLQKVQVHTQEYDQGLQTHTVGMNKYSDLSHEEFVRTMNGYKRRPSKIPTRTTMTTTLPTTVHTENSAGALAASVDWRTKGYVTAIKDQGHCGSCWAFSTTGALEGQHFKKTGTLLSLSEQQLIDCDYNCRSSNCGCGGGAQQYAFEYLVGSKGIEIESIYPYTARRGNCKFTAANVAATVAFNNTYPEGYVSLPDGNEIALASAVATIGPISVAMDASAEAFQLYKSGIYGPSTCSSSHLDHAVLIVGYGHDSATDSDYWIVKNSWGTSWGMQGYFYLARNKNNMCGIATDATYPLA